MANVVTFYNLKGGQGKTTLATHYAIFSGSHFYTNDFLSGTEKIYKKKFPQGHFHLIRQKDKDLDREEKMVFDCGGFVDLKIPALVQASDLGDVPVSFQSMADLKAFFVTLEALAKLNPNILIVINNTKTAKIAEIETGLQEILKGKYPVKVVKQSAYMTYLANEGKTPFELMEMGGTAKALAAIQSQLTELFRFIMKYLKCLKLISQKPALTPMKISLPKEKMRRAQPLSHRYRPRKQPL